MTNVIYYRLTKEVAPCFVQKICLHCNDEVFFLMTQDQYDRWVKNLEYAQDVFPDTAPDIREWMISGTHPKCWDEMFSE